MALQVPDEVRKELEIDAPRERVWRAVTEPDELLGWFPTHGAEVDLRPGGLVRSALTEQIRQGNDTGWSEELDELRAYVEAGGRRTGRARSSPRSPTRPVAASSA